MHLSSLLTVAIASTSVSACTFIMVADKNANTGDGSGGGGCSILIDDRDLTKDDIGNTKDVSFSGEGTCSEGCDTVDYNGKKWEFCHSILSPFESEITDITSVTVRQVDNNGNKLSIYPDGDYKHFSSVNPFSSLMTNYFFRSDIAC